ncbi:MAG: LCP family protein [Candidatus Peribacteraceae bacterium]|nr:LCP family protein [Candidatus Peribacteraceae bacterium]
MSFQTRRLREERLPRALPAQKTAATALKTASPLLTMFRKKPKGTSKGTQKRITLLKRTAIVLLSLLLALALLAGMVQILASLKILNLRNVLGATAAELPADANGHTNFLLLGKGDDDHDGTDLTDTIMVASLDPGKTKSAVLLSIPRDLYVTGTEKMGKGRVNELYRDYKHQLKQGGMTVEQASQEAMRELMRELSGKLGLEIHHGVMVNFSGLVQAVDALGGIDVDVPYDIVDIEYPGPDYTYETFSIEAGPRHLDGATALKYARSRHTTSDFGRSARQQQIIQALADNAQKEGLARSPGKLLSLYRILAENVETTLSTSEMLGAAKMGQELDRSQVVMMQVNDRNGLYGTIPEAGGLLYNPPRDQFGGAAVLLPVGDSWAQLRLFAQLLLQHRSAYLSPSSVAILNAGAKAGLANRLGAELIRYGFSVERIENAAGDKRDTSAVLPLHELDQPVASFFSTLLKLPLEPAPAPTEQLPEDQVQQERVTILLGKDFTYSPLTALLPATP